MRARACPRIGIKIAGGGLQHGVGRGTCPRSRKALSPVPVIGVIEPGAEAAVAAAPSGRIAVIATEGTVKGGAYERAIRARNAKAQVTQQACPLFVPLAEEGLIDGAIAELVAKRYLDPLFAGKDRPECLVLGCTHFPVLATMIARVVRARCRAGGQCCNDGQAAERLLADQNLARDIAMPAPPLFLATDAPERFARVGQIFLGSRIAPDSVELVDLG